MWKGVQLQTIVLLSLLSYSLAQINCGNELWQPYTGQHVVGGTFQPSVPSNNQAACQARCVQIGSGCTGYDYSAGGCWTFDQAKQPTADPTTTHVQIEKRCPYNNGVCTFAYNGPYRLATTAGVPVQIQTNVNFNQCAENCLKMTNCVAINHRALGTTECQLILSSTAITNRRLDNDFDSYLFSTSTVCDRTTPITPGPPTGAPTVATCLGEYTVAQNSHAINGLPQSGVTTLDTCKQRCIANAQCKGFDFEAGAATACWIHQSAYTVTVAAGVTNYLLTSRTCGAACVPTYGVFPNQHAIGAPSAENGINDQPACQVRCTANLACMAYDFIATNAANQRCWLHTNINDLQNVVTQTGAALYVINRLCVQPTTTTTARPPGCIPTFTERANVHANGSPAPENAVNDEVSCRARCVANMNCVGADYVASAPVNQRCWLHTNTANLQNLIEQQGAKLMIIDRTCATPTPTPGAGACVPMYTSNPGNHAIGADAPTQGANTLVACQTVCSGNAACVGLDYNPSYAANTRCWIHTKSSDLSDVRSLAGFTLYTADRSHCEAECVPTYTTKANIHLLGSSGAENGLNSADACQRKCSATPACVAFDFDVNAGNNQKCWLHTSASDLRNERSAPGVTLYIASRDHCGCTPTYSSFPNQHAVGSPAPENGVNTEDDCKTRCSANTNCVALDYNSGAELNQRCWLHTNINNLQNTRSQSGTTMFVIDRNCDATTSAKPTITECPPTYATFSNRHADGAAPDSSATTVDACKDRCNANDKCVGFDFDSRTNIAQKCWIHNNVDNLQTTIPDQGVDHYVINRACGATTSAPGPTPCPTTYTALVDMQGVGAPAPSPSGVTQGTCQDLCTRDDTCFGFDFDSRSATAADQRCWLHMNAANIAAGTRRPLSGITLYIAIRNCPCQPTFTSFPNVHAIGAQNPTAVADTNARCQIECINNAACIGYDFDSKSSTASSQRCWIHVNSNDQNNLQPDSGVTWYLINRDCDPRPTTSQPPVTTACPPVFTATPNTHAIGTANPTSDGTNLDLCKGECARNANCIGFDFDSRVTTQSNQRCWIHTNPADANNLKADNGLTWYTIDRSCECVPTFTAYINRNARGANAPTASGTTKDLCQTLCINSLSCIGFDFDSGPSIPANQRCWIHTNINDKDNLKDTFGITFYLINRACGPTPTPTGATTTTRAPEPGRCDVDLLFIVDSSGSVRDDEPPNTNNWEVIKSWLEGVVRSLPIGLNDVRVGLITFSNFAQVRWDLDDKPHINDLTLAIKALPYAGGKTNTPAALERAYRDVFTPTGGDRSNVRNIVVLMTDGKTNVNQQTLPSVVNTLKSRVSGEYFAIGVTDKVDYGELQQLASRSNNVYTVEQFTDLRQKITTEVLVDCGTTPTPTPGPGPTTTLAPVPIGCPLDLTFLIDTSGSIVETDQQNWPRVKEFLKGFIDRLIIGPRDVQIAMVTFSSFAETSYYFNQAQNRGDLKATVDRLPFQEGETNTTGGFRLTRTEVFTGNRGDRPAAEDLIVIITDGEPNREQGGLNDEVRRVKGRNIDIIGVGITNKINVAIMNSIVTAPASSNYFFVEDFSSLLNHVQRIVQSSCKTVVTSTRRPTPGPTPSPTPGPAFCRADVVFVLDASGSIRDANKNGQPDNWGLVLQFASDMVKLLDIGTDKTHAGVVTFSDFGTVHIRLDEYYDANELANKISNIAYDGGNTNTTGGFFKARTDVFGRNGDRSSAPNLLIILTDGVPTYSVSELPGEVRAAKNANIDVMGVGVTDNVDEAQIRQWVTAANYYFNVDNFGGLASVVDEIIGRTCPGRRPLASMVMAALLAERG